MAEFLELLLLAGRGSRRLGHGLHVAARHCQGTVRGSVPFEDCYRNRPSPTATMGVERQLRDDRMGFVVHAGTIPAIRQRATPCCRLRLQIAPDRPGMDLAQRGLLEEAQKSLFMITLTNQLETREPNEE